MQTIVNKMKICRNCSNSSLQNKENMLISICLFQRVNETCEEFSDRQCTLCTYESGNDDRCELCMDLDGSPYFEKKVTV